MNNIYRYSLERYRGRGTRYTCPQCGRKYAFTRYIDNTNNQYLADNVGKCNRLDKCGYHYTPRQYFEDNPWRRDDSCSNFQKHRGFEQIEQKEPPQPKQPCTLPEWVATASLGRDSAHMRWLRATYGVAAAERVAELYKPGGVDDKVVFWQRDVEGRIRTGKIMEYDAATGRRLKGSGTIDWVHALMRREGVLPAEWELTQSLYGEHLLRTMPTATVAIVEAPKTAHVGSILLPDLVWVAVDSLSGLTAERLRPLKGRNVILFPDEGKGFSVWSAKVEEIAREVGFNYRVSGIMEGREEGADIADIRP